MVSVRTARCKRGLHGLSLWALLWKPSSTLHGAVQPWVKAPTSLQFMLTSPRDNNNTSVSGLLGGLNEVIKSFNKRLSRCYYTLGAVLGIGTEKRTKVNKNYLSYGASNVAGWEKQQTNECTRYTICQLGGEEAEWVRTDNSLGHLTKHLTLGMHNELCVQGQRAKRKGLIKIN